MKTVPASRILLLASAALVLGLAGCNRGEEAAAPAEPAQTTAPPAAVEPAATEEGQMQATEPTLTDEQKEMIAAGQKIGACYTTANCTPVHNPPPGQLGVTQAACKASGGGSWQEMSVGPLGGIVWGSCVSPP